MKKFRIMTSNGPVAIEGDLCGLDNNSMLSVMKGGVVVAVFSDWRYWQIWE